MGTTYVLESCRINEKVYFKLYVYSDLGFYRIKAVLELLVENYIKSVIWLYNFGYGALYGRANNFNLLVTLTAHERRYVEKEQAKN